MMRFVFLLLAALSVSACSTLDGLWPFGGEETGRRTGGRGAYKVGNPYQIKGIWYHPAEDYNYDETGIASWYGPGFHGEYTANGEVFDTHELTAAHRTLPMPSLVRVTNLDNGRQLVLRINDRGPYAAGRIIDISKRGAELLGFIGNGTARVRVQILPDESRALAAAAKGRGATPKSIAHVAKPQPPVAQNIVNRDIERVQLTPPVAQAAELQNRYLPPPTMRAIPPVATSGMFIQVGAFSSAVNAEKLRARLAAFGQSRISPVTRGSQTFYRVQVGPFQQMAAADNTLQRMLSSGHNDARIIVD